MYPKESPIIELTDGKEALELQKPNDSIEELQFQSKRKNYLSKI